jgi:hypothetical protein
MRLFFATLGIFAACLPAAAIDDPFPGAPRASLHVSIELAGNQRVDMPNQVEWAAIEAWRTLEVEFALVDVGNDGYPIVSSGAALAETPSAVSDLEAALEACGEDQGCLAKAMMAFAKASDGSSNPFLEMTGQQPGRFRNFAADRTTVCASGTLVVEDVLSGVYIPPPEAARPYRFTRAGNLTLPQDDFGLMDYACRVEVTLDQASGQMSLRLPAAKLDVPVALGPGAFTDEMAVPLIEGLQVIELFDQPAGGDGKWSGLAQLGAAGSASHNSGQVVAPLSARITWRLVEG